MAMQYEQQLIPHGQNQPQSLPSVLQQGLGRTGWHSQTDEEQRQLMATHIFNIFQQRKPTSEQYASRLPDFVRRLEDVLYKQAKSLAEYVDLATLDNRLQAVALHFVGRPSAQVNTSGSSPHAAGSQGLPGHDMLHHSQQQQQLQMAPNTLPVMAGGIPQMQQQQAQQQQQQVSNPYAPINPVLNGNYAPQPSPAFSPGGGAIRSNYMSNGMLAAAPAPGDNSMPGAGFTPRQSPAAIPSNGVYGGNVPSLPVMSNGAPVLRNSANRDWMGQNLQQHGMNVGAQAGALKGHMNGMVPSPQLSGAGMMPMPMPMGGNGPSSSMGNGMVPSAPFFGSQNHQAPSHHSGYELGPTPGTGAAKMMPITNNNYQSPSHSHHLVPVPTAAGGPGTAPSFAPQSSGGNGGGLGPGPVSGFVPQNQSNSGGLGSAFGTIPSGNGNGGGLGSSFGGQSLSGNGGGQNGLGPEFIPQNQGVAMAVHGSGPGFNGQNPGQTEGPAFGSAALGFGGNNSGGLGPGSAFGQLNTVSSGGGPPTRATSGGGGAVGGPPGPPSLLPGVPDDATDEMRHTHVQKQQRWLLYLRHCAKCHVPGNECSLKQQCKFGKQLWQHILSCQETECPFPRCTTSKELLKHHQRCQNISCPICAPVKEYVRKTRIATAQHTEQQQQRLQQQQQQQHQNGGQLPLLNGMMPINNGNGNIGHMQMHPHQQQPQQQHPQHSQHSQHNQHPQHPQQPDMRMGQDQLSQQPRQQRFRPAPDSWPSGSQPTSAVSGHKRGHGMIEEDGSADRKPAMMVDSKGFAMPAASSGMQHSNGSGHDAADPAVKEDPVESERKRQAHEDLLGKNTGTSLLEAYEPRMIHDHVLGLQHAAQAQRELQADAPPHDICKVCLLTKLSFEPPVIYCTQCACKIKRGQTYYSTAIDASNDIKGSWCHNCYQEPKGDKLNFDGAPLKKTDLMKRKNDDEIEEAWVQCDHCEFWVHQVCGMFNKGKNNPDVRYLCPECLLLGMRQGRRQRITSRPQSMLEAKDLPRCYLSDQLQDRLDRQLDLDWKRRVQEQGGHNVLRCEPITVRVINSVMKSCSVRHEFAESFRNEGYPTEFPYRQRVILLFQNLDGVDVCLFCLYVQEYGKDCPAPNTNCVYLSYLDSIKYFRPEVPAAGGNASIGLRTFAYHQLLIGYLAHIKKLGFEQMYIWACPPMAGDDYILYCHPSKQKTPRSDRLRQWYIEMLKTAKEEGIVKHITTLWDTYFEGGKDHRSERCSATHIPYLEGDYWPGEAENLLTESLKAANKSNKKGSGLAAGGASGSSAGRAAAKGKRYGSGPTTADELLMGRLGEILGGNMKEDFIVVHLTEVCTFCRTHLRGGSLIHRYRSHTPLKPAPVTRFEGIKIEQGPSIPINPYHQLSICDACYVDEDHRYRSQMVTRLPTGLSTQDLSTSMVEDLQPQQISIDNDIDMDNEFFETRQTFLSLCQGNHYQFDTLRRAKHSSMMVLYHLHNPSAPAFTTSCNHCQREIEPGAGFRCTVCADFDICATCKLTTTHAHPFMAHVKKAHETQIRLTDAERRERHEQLQRTMALLIHACQCNSSQCISNSCRKVKALMAHANECVPSVSGGCLMCRKMWVLLNLHSKCCNKANCAVPRCSELKEMRRRQTCRQEDQRRSAYTTMAQQQ